jgi:hypothetical protein
MVEYMVYPSAYWYIVFLGTLTFCYFRMMEHAERQRTLLEFIVNPDV